MMQLLNSHTLSLRNSTPRRNGASRFSLCMAALTLSIMSGCAGADAGTKNTIGDLSSAGGSDTAQGSGGQLNGASGGNTGVGSGGSENNSGGSQQFGSGGRGGGMASGGSTNGGNDGTGGTIGEVDGSSGCGLQAPFDSQQTVVQQIDGTERSYILIPPDNYNPNKAYALVFGFHGAGGVGDHMVAGLSGMREYTKDQAFYLFPNSDAENWDYRGRDLLLIDEASNKTFNEWCIDESRVFAVGFSDGGWMAAQAACSRSELLHAAAVFSGGGRLARQQCGAAIPVIISHGADTDSWSHQSADLYDFFPAHAGCNVDAPLVSTNSPPCEAYQGCSAGADVWSCVHDQGHDLPDFSRTVIWDFFSSH